MTGRTRILDRFDLMELGRRFDGPLLLPGDEGYDGARQVWNAMIDRRPALIARCTSPTDVVQAIRFGRARELEIGVRCGGHSVLGLSVPDGGLAIDLTPMGRVQVDPDRRRAWVQGGALLGALDRATQPYGLATTAGNVSHTGVGGLTLGGGMGWLARRFGLACDNVESFEVVLANGEIVRASAAQNSDLFWALCGGGGNFGVVTEFEFRLHDVGTAAVMVDLFYRPDDAAEAMRRWRALLPDAPREATLTAWAGTAGDAAYLPDDLHHRSLISVGYVWVGDPSGSRELLAELHNGPPPAAESVQELTYLELQSLADVVERHRIRRYWKGHYLGELRDEAIDAFISRGSEDHLADPAVLPYASFQAYGGAIAEVGDAETAFSHRDTAVEFVAAAGWIDPDEDQARITAARRYGTAMEPFAIGSYVNALSDEGESGLRRAYDSAHLARLSAIKATYDPENVFHLNHNIAPTMVI